MGNKNKEKQINMQLKINRNKCDTDRLLQMNTSILVNPVFLDITQGNSSQRILTMEEEGKYLLFFSRPILFNIFKLPLYDYEFKFVIEQSQSSEESIVRGHIMPKRYIIGAIIIAMMVFAYGIFDDIISGMGFSILFYVYVPFYGLIYFTTGYLYFKYTIKKQLFSLLLRN